MPNSSPFAKTSSTWCGPINPPVRFSPIVPHDIRFSGKSSGEKRHEVAQTLEKNGTDAAVLTLPDPVAWLLNVRGSDVGHTPLALSYAILRKDGSVDWFVDQRKLVPGLIETLGNEIAIQPMDDFGKRLSELGAAGAKVRTDPATAAAYVFDQLSGAEILREEDPCALPKAIKKKAEIDGTRTAHERDGFALTRYLHWLSKGTKGRRDGDRRIGPIAQFQQKQAHFETLVFRQSRRPVPTAQWSITMRQGKRTASWDLANSISSTRAPNISTARLTSPARLRSEPRPQK